LMNFLVSIRKGKIASGNPWNGNTLEWTTAAQPGHGNWPGEIPTVHRWPYDYSKPGAKYDYLPQNVADDDPDWFEGVPSTKGSPTVVVNPESVH